MLNSQIMIRQARHTWTPGDDWTVPRDCTKCGVRRSQYGVGQDRYSVFSKDGQIVANTASGDKTPPCTPSAVESAPNPLRVKVIGGRADGDERPSRAMRCEHCGSALEWLPGGQWTAANGPGLTGRSAECTGRPGNDGHGPHEPGTPIAHPPVAS